MPIFENPDENSHADYVFVLLTTGHLIRAADGVPATDVHPYTRYLKRAANVDGIRFNNAGRVPAGYGTAAYDSALDANAPHVDAHAFDRGLHPVPYVALINSFFYYALDAMAMRAGSWLNHGSLTTAFAAGRALGILFLGIALVLLYLILRERHLPVRYALVLVAAIGWFPQLSSLCASIQPDSLGVLAVPAALYVALRCHRLGMNPWRALLLGLTLAVAAITKAPYGLALTLAIAPLAVILCRRLPTTAAQLRAAALIVVPAIVLLATSLSLSRSPYAGRIFVAPSTDGVVAQLPQGLWALFSFSRPSLTFWHAFGISQIISLGGDGPTVLTHCVLVAASLTVLAFLCVREVRVLGRLARIARVRSLGTAVTLAFSDVVLVSYFIFIAIMAVLYALTQGELGSGRYFIPFILAAWLCGVWYMPQILSPQGRYVARPIILAFLLGYSVIESAFSWGAIERRYYTPLPPAQLVYEENGQINSPSPDTPVAVRRGTVLPLVGWTFDSTTSTPARAVIALVDHRDRIPLHTGEAREDIVRLYHDDDLLHSGFRGWIDTATFSTGPHVISIVVHENGRTVTFPPDKEVTFLVH
ncbi:MAG TPA: hypothetical protein VME66_10390 [Candidatus Acidoferrales bacterium]|nr:hypothetical protein [Candidatus Acidoferrales bacterium]